MTALRSITPAFCFILGGYALGVTEDLVPAALLVMVGIYLRDYWPFA